MSKTIFQKFLGIIFATAFSYSLCYAKEPTIYVLHNDSKVNSKLLYTGFAYWGDHCPNVIIQQGFLSNGFFLIAEPSENFQIYTQSSNEQAYSFNFQLTSLDSDKKEEFFLKNITKGNHYIAIHINSLGFPMVDLLSEREGGNMVKHMQRLNTYSPEPDCNGGVGSYSP